jgi:hypothetical protein
MYAIPLSFFVWNPIPGDEITFQGRNFRVFHTASKVVWARPMKLH